MSNTYFLQLSRVLPYQHLTMVPVRDAQAHPQKPTTPSASFPVIPVLSVWAPHLGHAFRTEVGVAKILFAKVRILLAHSA